MISLLTRLAEGYTLEVAIVGSEGIAGLPAFLGVETSVNQAIVQDEETAFRIRTEHFFK